MEWSIPANLEKAIQNQCVEEFPLEACGLFLGPVDSHGAPTGEIVEIWPTANSAQSARIYEIDSKDMFAANKYAQSNNLEIVGVYHSHTHSEAFPSSTDIEKSIDPKWCYAIASLMEEQISLRYFQIRSGEVSEVKGRII